MSEVEPAAMTDASAAAHLPRAALLREEVWIVLALSLLQSAVFAVIDLFAAPLRGEVRVTFPQVPLAQQIAYLAFGLAPVWLVLYLLKRDGERPATIGLTRDSPTKDLLAGGLLALLVGAGGALLYLAAVSLGVNRIVIPVPPIDHWWTIPIVLGGAAVAALLEEIVVTGYLITRLRELGRTPAFAIGVSALLRASYHLYQGWGGFFGNLVMGVLFGWLFLRRGRLWPLIIAHFLLDVGAGAAYLLLHDHVPWL